MSSHPSTNQTRAQYAPTPATEDYDGEVRIYTDPDAPQRKKGKKKRIKKAGQYFAGLDEVIT